MPDLTARYTTKGDWGHFSVAGLVRQLRTRPARSTRTTDSTGYGVSVSGKFNLGSSDDIRYMVTAGSGIGRYLGLGLSNDARAGRQRRSADASTLIGGFVGWRHVFTPEAAQQPVLFARRTTTTTSTSPALASPSARSPRT